MSNLIITIISIALVTVAAIAATWYGGQALSGSQSQVLANMLINQTQQLFAINNAYMVNNVYSSYNDFHQDDPFIAGYGTAGSRVPILQLSATGGSNSTNNGYPLNTSNLNHSGCGPLNKPAYLNGYQVYSLRTSVNIFSKNSIVYGMVGTSANSSCNQSNIGLDLSQASMAQHPLVQMCLKINTQANLPTSGLTYTASGLPYITATPSATWVNAPSSSPYAAFDYINNPIAVNFCVLAQNTYWAPAGQYPEIIYVATR